MTIRFKQSTTRKILLSILAGSAVNTTGPAVLHWPTGVVQQLSLWLLCTTALLTLAHHLITHVWIIDSQHHFTLPQQGWHGPDIDSIRCTVSSYLSRRCV